MLRLQGKGELLDETPSSVSAVGPCFRLCWLHPCHTPDNCSKRGFFQPHATPIRSSSNLEINEAGNAVFSGTISLANGGGFSSIQRDFDTLDVSAYRVLCLGLRGDGKRYQVRVESTPNAPHGYAFDFETSGDWQTVEIPFPELYAIHHGDRLDLPAYPGQALSRIQILAGDGRAETFVLELDRVWLIK